MESVPTQSLTAYRPVLFLGLGGTGKEVLLRLRLRLAERFRTYDVPFARFLWIDTDTRATDARGQNLSSALSTVGFDEGEKYALLSGTVGNDLRDIFENPGRWPHIHEWLYQEVRSFGNGIADGAGGVRAVGRLTFFAKYAGLRRLIEQKLDELSRQETIHDTQEFFARHSMPPVGTDGNSAPTIFVVTSLAGGTGCGTFIDTGFLLQDIKVKRQGNLGEAFAYAVMPNVYNASPQGEIPQRSFANAYAALKELDHFTKRIKLKGSQDTKENNPYSDFIVSWERQLRLKIPGPPYSATYLIEIANQANISISQENRGDLFSMLAETLFMDLLPGPFSDAKRSNHSNIAAGLASHAGAETGAAELKFRQNFARRYAACGMSKMEIPLDTVRGACAAKLATEIFDYIRRDKEDADVGRSLPRDLTSFQLDENGIYNSFGDQWKNVIREAVGVVMQQTPVSKPDDAGNLRLRLAALESETVLVDSDRIGTSVRWLRQRTPTVTAETKARLFKMLNERVLENPERGLATAIRKGYFDLAIDRTKALIDPTRDGDLGAFDRAIKAADMDAEAFRFSKEYELNELDIALHSFSAKVFNARNQVVKLALDRVVDTQQQYFFAVADKYLLIEAKKVAQELLRVLRETRDALTGFLDKADAIRGAAEGRLQTFQTRLSTGTHVLFLQLFDAERDWPRFYKLGLNSETQQPAEVDPAKEYVNLLRFFESTNGLADLAETLRQQTSQEVGKRIEEFCDRRFYDDMVAHPRQVSVLDHPKLRDPRTSKQVLQGFVNQAQPMLRRDEKVAASEVESTTFAYLGIANHTSPETRKFIEDVTEIANCKIETFDTGKPNEIYLYFSTFAFPLPSVSLVQNECHAAYTDFYAQFNPGTARKAETGIPLHLSRRWEGRFDDLVVYSDLQTEALEEALRIVNLAPALNILTVQPDESGGLPDFMYKDAPPFNKMNSLGKKRTLLSRLMGDVYLREALFTEVKSREANLTADQLTGYFWALQAQLFHPDMEDDLPDYQLLREQISIVHRRAEMQPATAGLVSVKESDSMRDGGELEWIRAQKEKAGIDWPSTDQPVVHGLEQWRKPFART